MSIVRSDKPFVLAGRTYQSRLLVGTGKYRDMEETRLAIEASGAEIVTFAVRRTNLGQNPGEPNLLEVLSPDRYTFLPNTAGCFDATEAVRTCRLARELLGGHNLVKLEVLADQKTLFPNVIETLKAAEVLVKEGFDVMVYTSDDPIIARQLAEIGCYRGDAAGRSDRHGPGDLQPVQPADHPRRSQDPCAGGCRCRYRFRRHHRHGTGLRSGADELGHRPCPAADHDG